MKKPTYCSNANYDVFIQLVTILSFTFGAEENSYFNQEKWGASVFCSKSKKYFFLKRKHAFYEPPPKKNRKCDQKGGQQGTIFVFIF